MGPPLTQEGVTVSHIHTHTHTHRDKHTHTFGSVTPYSSRAECESRAGLNRWIRQSKPAVMAGKQHAHTHIYTHTHTHIPLSFKCVVSIT